MLLVLRTAPDYPDIPYRHLPLSGLPGRNESSEGDDSRI